MLRESAIIARSPGSSLYLSTRSSLFRQSPSQRSCGSLWSSRRHISATNNPVWPKDHEGIGPSRTRSNAAPGTYRPVDLPKLVRQKSSPHYDSTLTQIERSIFQRIYKDILEELPTESAPQDVANGGPDKTEWELFDENETLESIFQKPTTKTTQGISVTKEAEATSSSAQAPGASDSQHTQDSKPETEIQKDAEAADKSQAELTNEARSKDSIDFETRLASVRTDVEISNVLHSHVMQKMKALARAIYKESSNAKRSKSKTEPPKSKKKLLLAESQEVDVQNQRPWLQDPEVARLLSVLRSNYASQCVACLNALRTRFPRSAYVLTILPTIKSFGPISYVLGASTELYNELLFIRWVYYRDLHGCADLLDEMLNRSIAIDGKTVAVFKDAERKREQAEECRKDDIAFGNETSTASDQPRMNGAAAAWWFLQGNEAGWKRWQAAQDSALQWVREEQSRKAAEQSLVEEDEDDYDDEEMEEEDGPDIEVVMPSSKEAA